MHMHASFSRNYRFPFEALDKVGYTILTLLHKLSEVDLIPFEDSGSGFFHGLMGVWGDIMVCHIFLVFLFIVPEDVFDFGIEGWDAVV